MTEAVGSIGGVLTYVVKALACGLDAVPLIAMRARALDEPYDGVAVGHPGDGLIMQSGKDAPDTIVP